MAHPATLKHPDRAAGRHTGPRPSNAHLARRPVAGPVGAPSLHRGRRADGGDGAGHGGHGRQAQPWRPGPARPSACRSRRPAPAARIPGPPSWSWPDDRPPGGVLAADQARDGPPWLGVQVEPSRLELKALWTETARPTPRRAPRAAAETRSVPVRFGLGGPGRPGHRGRGGWGTRAGGAPRLGVAGRSSRPRRTRSRPARSGPPAHHPGPGAAHGRDPPPPAHTHLVDVWVHQDEIAALSRAG